MPRIALISDIHGNIDALDAVLADIDQQEINEIACLGDIIGYGAAPAECLRLVRERCKVTVLGNHDDYLVKGLEDFVFSKLIGGPLYLAQQTIPADDLLWLAAQPYVAEINGFSIVHASLSDPEEFTYLDTDHQALFHFHDQKTDASFYGHTHRPELLIRQEHEIHRKVLYEGDVLLDMLRKCAVNVGSVGQPRDRDPRSAYGVYDTGEHSFTLRRVTYDIEKAALRITSAGLSAENAERLYLGW